MRGRCLVRGTLSVCGLVAAVLGLAWACVTGVETQRSQLILIPDSQMNALGGQAYSEVLKTAKKSSVPAHQEMIRRIGMRIAKASAAKYDWEFEVIDDPKTVNAFCLPGGKIAFYTGIFPVAENEAAIAAIMGHEVAHATARHGAERMSHGVVAQVGLAALDGVLSKNKNRGLILGALGVGTQVGVMLPFSRSHESEADRIGLRYMAKAGYDPQEAVALWKRMAAQGGRTPELLSTHPDPLRRAEDLAHQIAEVRSLYESSDKQPSSRIASR